MLHYLRVFIVISYFLIFCLGIIFYMLRTPFSSNNTHNALKLFKPAHRLINLDVICLKGQTHTNPAIYIANHQNLLDIFLLGQAWPNNSAVIGKQSLIWVPFFGIAYWLAGNIFINRKNKEKAWAMVDQVAETVHEKQLSFIFMPEGTRSKGRGLLPFKKGAFAAAIQAGVPIIPICASSACNIDLNQWHPKTAYVSYLDPIPTAHLTENDAPALAEKCHALMLEKITELDKKVLEEA